MRVAVGSDHAGFELKQHVKALLAREGHAVLDAGPATPDPIDYPSIAADAARLVASEKVDLAVLVCGSGVGVSIAANKIDGVRAVNAHDPEEAELARRHNDANVLTLAGRRLNGEQADAIVHAFLGTDFEGGRHTRRITMITELEGL